MFLGIVSLLAMVAALTLYPRLKPAGWQTREIAYAAAPPAITSTTLDVSPATPTPVDPTPVATAAAQLRPTEVAVLMSALPIATSTPVPKPPLLGRDAAAARIASMISGQKGQYAVCVVDLASQQWYGKDAEEQMDAASVNKVAILAAVYHQASLSRLDLTQVVATTANDIQDYGTGSIRYDPIGSSYSVRTLAKLMIEQSDNTASYMLARVVGIQTIQRLLDGWGLHSTLIGDDMTSARDMSIMLELIYRKQVASPALTSEMMDFLTHTDYKDRIPALLPQDVQIGHKIGNHVGVLNDAGIVFLAGRPYIVVMLGENVDETQALLLEQELSKAVYDFESGLPAILS